MMVSRRVLLGGLSLLPLATSLTGCSARAVGASGAPTSGPVGPHATWNGPANSGAGPPGPDPTRVVAKVIAAFTVPSFQRINSGLFSVRVKADAAGGMSYVRFFGDCVSTKVTTPKLIFVPTVHGTTRHEYVYEILLDVDAFRAKNPSVNTINIYAECTAIDSVNVVTRSIGPLVLFPENAANNSAANGVHVGYFSLDGRLGPDGNASAIGIVAAFTAARVAILGGKTAAVLTCIQTGTYEPGLGAAAGYSTPARGYCVVKAETGVTCTIGRSSIPDVNSSSGWYTASGINGVEWRGAGIVFDNAYLTVTVSQNSSNRPDWFNGCTWTNSLGRDSLWNGQQHPGRGPEGTSTTSFPSYYTDCYFENGGSPFTASVGLLDLGNRSNSTYGDLHSGGRFVHAAYDTNSTSDWFTAIYDAISITYSGAGNATIAKAGYGGGKVGASSNIVVVANGVTYTFEPKQFPNQANSTTTFWSWAELVACLNTISGVTATDLSPADGGRTARYNYAPAANGATTNGWTATAFSVGGPFSIKSYMDIHADWYQSGGVANNVIITNCVTAGLVNDYSGMFFMGNETDTLVENCIMLAATATANGWAGSNFRYRNNTIGSNSTTFGTNTSTYSEFSNNASSNINGVANNNPSVRNNYYTAGPFPTGTNTTGSFTGGTFAGQFVNSAGDVVDMRPAAATALLTGLVATLASCPYDILGNLRSATDCAGAISKNQGSAPTWPMAT